MFQSGHNNQAFLALLIEKCYRLLFSREKIFSRYFQSYRAIITYYEAFLLSTRSNWLIKPAYNCPANFLIRDPVKQLLVTDQSKGSRRLSNRPFLKPASITVWKTRSVYRQFLNTSRVYTSRLEEAIISSRMYNLLTLSSSGPSLAGPTKTQHFSLYNGRGG